MGIFKRRVGQPPLPTLAGTTAPRRGRSNSRKLAPAVVETRTLVPPAVREELGRDARKWMNLSATHTGRRQVVGELRGVVDSIPRWCSPKEPDFIDRRHGTAQSLLQAEVRALAEVGVELESAAEEVCAYLEAIDAPHRGGTEVGEPSEPDTYHLEALYSRAQAAVDNLQPAMHAVAEAHTRAREPYTRNLSRAELQQLINDGVGRASAALVGERHLPGQRGSALQAGAFARSVYLPTSSASEAWGAAEELAVHSLRGFGFDDAQKTNPGSDSGLDVVGAAVAAQVKYLNRPVGRPDLQRLMGSAGGRVPAFFSRAGFSVKAREYAEEVEIALFMLALPGSVRPLNNAARSMSAD